MFFPYSGVRVKGTKNKVGLQEAFADKESKGYSGTIPCYNVGLILMVKSIESLKIINVMLFQIQLHNPDNIRTIINDTISTATQTPKEVQQVGIKLMKFCARHELNKISEQVQSYSEPIKCEIRMQLMDENYADAYELLESWIQQYKIL